MYDRAPVVIPPGMYAQWLDPQTTDKDEVQKVLGAIAEPVLTPQAVTDRVNSVRSNGPEFIDPAA